MIQSRVISSDDLVTAGFDSVADDWATRRGVSALASLKANASALGITGTMTDLGSGFSTVIGNNKDVKTALQALESAVINNSTSINNLRKFDVSNYPGWHGDGSASDAAAILAAITANAIAEAIDSEIANGTGELVFPAGCTLIIDRSIHIPFSLNINFNGCKIIPVAGAGGDMSAFYTDGTLYYMFLLNASLVDGTQIVNYSGNWLPTIRNAIVYNRDSLSNIVAFYSKSKHNFNNVHTYSMTQFFKKPASNNGNDYTDLINFKNINIAKSPVSSYYAIELGYHGDGVRLEGVHIYKGTAPANTKLLKMDRTQGAVIYGGINGDVYATRCMGIEFIGGHTEFGTFWFESTNASVKSYCMWIHPEAVAAGYMIKCSRIAADHPTGSVNLENVQFRVIPNRNGLPQAVSTDFTDVLVDVDADIDIKHCFRSFESTSDPSIFTKSAIKLGFIGQTGPNSTWEDRATYFTRDASVIGGIIKTKFNSHNVPATISDPTMNSENTNAGNWQKPSGTYLYRFQYLIGPKSRKIGINSSTTFAPTLTQTTGGCRRWTWPRTLATNNFTGQMTIRIYRSSTNTVDLYDEYVDLATVSIPDFYDTGFFLSTGEYWQARTPGPVDSINSNINELFIRDSTVIYRGTAAPAAGTFSTGDLYEDVGNFEIWQRDQTGTRWRPTGSRPYTVPNPVSGQNIGSNYGWYAALYNQPIAADRILTLTAGSKIPGMMRELSRAPSCTGAFNVSFTDGTTTWSLGADSTKFQRIILRCDLDPANGNTPTWFQVA